MSGLETGDKFFIPLHLLQGGGTLIQGAFFTWLNIVHSVLFFFLLF